MAEQTNESAAAQAAAGVPKELERADAINGKLQQGYAKMEGLLHKAAGEVSMVAHFDEWNNLAKATLTAEQMGKAQHPVAATDGAYADKAITQQENQLAGFLANKDNFAHVSQGLREQIAQGNAEINAELKEARTLDAPPALTKTATRTK